MEAESCQKVDLEFEALGCVQLNHFSENQFDLNNYESPQALGAGKEGDISLGIDVDGHLQNVHNSTEPERTHTNKRYNLRQSLAWNTAFFTSAGVLDPEELSSMITGADVGEKYLLPEIEEDTIESSESISTLESDSLNLETLEEEDLFLDIRASIQRSSKKISNLTNSSSDEPAIEVDRAPISFLEEYTASRNKNSKLAVQKTSSMQTKSLPKTNVVKHGSGKAMKKDLFHSQVTSIAKLGEKNPKISNKPKATRNSISTTATAKRDSIGIGFGKPECASSKLGTRATILSKGTQQPNVSDGARRMLPRTAVSSKPSLSRCSSTGRVQSESSTSGGNSSSMSFGTHAKSQLMMGRRNPCRSSLVPDLSGPTPKTPRAVLKNSPPPSTLSAYLMSNKISSVSLPSSMSERSSALSSSVINNGFNNSRTCLDSHSCGSVDGNINLLHSRNPSAEQTGDGHANQGVSLRSNNLKNSSTAGIFREMKPSGLRMPSPKIGFFEGVNSLACAPNDHQQLQLGSGTVFSKKGTSVSSHTNGTTAPTARVIASLACTKPDSVIL